MFREYLFEALGPQQTLYGTNTPDYNNKQFDKKDKNIISTIVKINENRYIVKLEVYDKKYKSYVFSFALYTDSGKQIFDTTKSGVNAYGVFNKIIYVFTEMLGEVDLDSVVFEASDRQHQDLYNTMLKSSMFNNLLERYGFEPLRKENVFYYTVIKGKEAPHITHTITNKLVHSKLGQIISDNL